jgi:glycosyltransferase involved in cell wall biosynthesis
MLIDQESAETTPVAKSTERSRLLIVACSCDPDITMEDRNGWHRAIQAAEDFDVTVLTIPSVNTERLYRAVPNHLQGRIEFLGVPLPAYQAKRLECDKFFYLGYRAWLVAGKKLAEKLHKERPFAITHLVSLCSYREAGYFWQIDCPFILGPVGGSSGFPVRYLGLIGFRSAAFEIARNFLNSYQLNLSGRVRQAIKSSAIVIAANRSTQRDLMKMVKGLTVPVELEAGLDYAISPPKPVRDIKTPLKILWSGRLRAWKALPLLLHALAKMPKDVPVQLRVVGDGVELTAWRRLAERLGLTDHVEWISRPPYRDSLEYYRWADVFCFTSLRDTSGTGLLEALAAGTPIIGMNHQGAADIMTDDCAMKISVDSPRKSISEITAALVLLARDPSRLKKMSDAALREAQAHLWPRKAVFMKQIYQSLHDNPLSRPKPSKLPSETQRETSVQDHRDFARQAIQG